MHDVVFSTAYDGLEKVTPPPPRVTVHWDRQLQLIISWSHTIPSLYGAERQDPVIGDPFPILKPYLIDLWRETRRTDALPPGLLEDPTG
jgi:hypothetical protein